MSSPDRVNPFAAPQTQEPSLALPSIAQREIPLDPPIEIDGQYTLNELVEANRLMSQVIVSRGKRVVFYGFMTLTTISIVAQMLIAPGIFMGSILVACVLFWGWKVYSGPLMRRRMRAFLTKQEQLGHRARGIVTAQELKFIPYPTESAEYDESESNLPWAMFVDARLGESALVLRRPYPRQPKRWAFQILSRSVFRNEADWQRFRDYVERRFDFLPKVVTSAPCGRCRRELPLADLAPPNILFRWLWPPMMIRTLLTDGREVSYCRPCRRSVSFALFFIGFLLAMVALMVLLSLIALMLGRSNSP